MSAERKSFCGHTTLYYYVECKSGYSLDAVFLAAEFQQPYEGPNNSNFAPCVRTDLAWWEARNPDLVFFTYKMKTVGCRA